MTDKEKNRFPQNRLPRWLIFGLWVLVVYNVITWGGINVGVFYSYKCDQSQNEILPGFKCFILVQRGEVKGYGIPFLGALAKETHQRDIRISFQNRRFVADSCNENITVRIKKIVVYDSASEKSFLIHQSFNFPEDISRYGKDIDVADAITKDVPMIVVRLYGAVKGEHLSREQEFVIENTIEMRRDIQHVFTGWLPFFAGYTLPLSLQIFIGEPIY
jgi:hypothetical protein